MKLEPMTRVHWPSVRRIYREGIATGHSTFETRVPDWEAFHAGHLEAGRLVAVDGGEVVGWTALAPVSSRAVYRGVAEVSVYVAADRRGLGVGSLLLRAQVDASCAAGVWTLQAGIFPENTSSLQLHRSRGFREVGRRERLGHLGGRWRDMLLLERRSELVGADPELPRPLLRFVELFNREAFWESHEVLEGPWREMGSEFYHGLILYASAFVHQQRENRHGIRAQLAKAEGALGSFEANYLGVDVAGILRRCRELPQRLVEGVQPADLSLPRLELSRSRVRGDEEELGGR